MRNRSGKNHIICHDSTQGPEPGCFQQCNLSWYDMHELRGAARQVQARMRRRTCGRKILREPEKITTIAGADAAYRGCFGTGVVIVLSFPDLRPLCHAYANRVVTFPYIPGLFGFRELPLIMAAFEKLPVIPDILLLDGHGYAHPRRFGSACQAGASLDIPTIGCAKRLLTGQYLSPGRIRGSCSSVIDQDTVIGMAVRTKTGARPVFVSAGYRTDLDCAVRIVQAAGGNHRIPEPLRMADMLARDYRDLFFPLKTSRTRVPDPELPQ